MVLCILTHPFAIQIGQSLPRSRRRSSRRRGNGCLQLSDRHRLDRLHRLRERMWVVGWRLTAEHRRPLRHHQRLQLMGHRSLLDASAAERTWFHGQLRMAEVEAVELLDGRAVRRMRIYVRDGTPMGGRRGLVPGAMFVVGCHVDDQAVADRPRLGSVAKAELCESSSSDKRCVYRLWLGRYMYGSRAAALAACVVPTAPRCSSSMRVKRSAAGWGGGHAGVIDRIDVVLQRCPTLCGRRAQDEADCDGCQIEDSTTRWRARPWSSAGQHWLCGTLAKARPQRSLSAS